MSDTPPAPPVIVTKQNNGMLLVLGIGVAVTIILGAFLIGRSTGWQARANQVPVSTTFRRAIIGPGYVLQFHNKSRRTLPLKITVTSPTFNKTKTFDAVADPGPEPLEIGHMEGWTFASGDLIEIRSEGFTPVNVKIP